MNKQFSVYLDLIRFLAAIAVFISHVPGFSGGWLWQFAVFGHEAVVVFFVLSGFVISYVVYERKESLLKYAVNRLARIYSVAFPALILTLALYYIGMEINSSAFETLNEKLKAPIWTTFSAFFFINQSWTATPVFSNLPYWSLGYEVLYYLFFGVVVFAKGFQRIALLLLITLIMGPSILLYLPVWLAGVGCFKWLHKHTLSNKNVVFLYVVSIVGIVLLSQESIQLIINSFFHELIGDGFYQHILEPADQFSADYLLAIFVTLHIFSSYHLFQFVTLFNHKISALIKHLSSHTFSLYLYHMPILFFISAIAPYSENPILNLILAWIVTPLFIYCLSTYTENQKLSYKKLFEYFIVKLSFKNS